MAERGIPTAQLASGEPCAPQMLPSHSKGASVAALAGRKGVLHTQSVIVCPLRCVMPAAPLTKPGGTGALLQVSVAQLVDAL